jgi:nucleoid-associated protein YgaU
MALLDSFKLEKLKIMGFSDAARTQPVNVFEAMFNPESIKQQYGVRYGTPRGLGATDSQSVYLRTEPADLRLDLLLDGTGVTDDIALPPGPALKSVSERVEEFLQTAFHYQGDIHQPNYLLVQWGDIWKDGGFKCRLVSVEITYLRFDRAGKPLRAKLDISLRSDATWEEQIRQNNPSSPDLTHRYTVIAGDTLPLLSERIYGSAEHVAYIARVNRLDDLRFLTPGTDLTFPPLPGRGRQPRQ